MDEDYVYPGTYVIYHGSLTEHHGKRMAVESYVPPIVPLNEADTMRYRLRYGLRPTEILFNVRRKSFTIEVG